MKHVDPKFTKNIITRDEAMAICPGYVVFAEGDFDKTSAVLAQFENVKKGQAAITAHGHRGAPLIFLRVKISSVNYDDPRALDGPVVRVTNGEYSWRVDGDRYAYIISASKH